MLYESKTDSPVLHFLFARFDLHLPTLFTFANRLAR